MSWHPFKISLLFGIPMMATAIVLQVLNPSHAGQMIEGFRTPVLAFEFMQNAAETAGLFDVENPGMYRNDFMWGNSVDYLFMFFYSVFLGFTALGIIRETGLRILWLAVALCAIVFFADLLENITLASIVDAFFNQEELVASYYGNLHLFTWLKWGGLSVTFLLFTGYFLQRKIFGKAISLLILVNFGLSVAAFFHRSALNEFMALSVVLLFLALFVHNVSFRSDPGPELPVPG
jgi:hypothetical protein